MTIYGPVDSHLHGDASAALQLVAGGERHSGGDGGRRAGLQAVARAQQLRQGLQRVDAQLHKVTLERQRAQRSAGGLVRSRGVLLKHSTVIGEN